MRDKHIHQNSILNFIINKFSIVIFIFSFSSVFSQNHASPFIYILGNVQDAGLPHIGCESKICIEAFNKKKQYYVTSIALIDPENQEFSLFDVTPNITEQLLMISRDIFNKYILPKNIFITHAHIGHYTGLMYFGREALGSKGIKVNVLPRMYDFISNNGPWSQLVKLGNISLNEINFRDNIEIKPNLSVIPIQVPHRDEFSETSAFLIEGPNKTALFLPDIDKWSKWSISLIKMLENVDYAFIDATFYTNREINRDIDEIPHPLVIETMDLLSELPDYQKDKVHFIHMNHTNKMLDPTSDITINVLNKGFNIARLGQKFYL
ncbi:MAG: MBL fold metallo-hydrolase [Candidatus Marisimplicoccus sp.]